MAEELKPNYKAVMPQSPSDPSDLDPDDAQDSVNLGAVAPGEPYARAPVEIESLQLNPKSGQSHWGGPERRRSAALRPRSSGNSLIASRLGTAVE